jgi:hypothetical protein
LQEEFKGVDMGVLPDEHKVHLEMFFEKNMSSDVNPILFTKME